MRRGLEFVVLAVLLTALPACSTTPTGPDRTGPAEFDTTALFSRLAGSYTLTFDADDSCLLPPSLQEITYDVVLEPTRCRYLGVRVSGKPFVGDLWVLATEEQGFTLRWNVDCDTADTVGATTFYLCGEGDAQEAAISTWTIGRSARTQRTDSCSSEAAQRRSVDVGWSAALRHARYPRG
jgi:hypothetical protein